MSQELNELETVQEAVEELVHAWDKEVMESRAMDKEVDSWVSDIVEDDQHALAAQHGSNSSAPFGVRMEAVEAILKAGESGDVPKVFRRTVQVTHVPRSVEDLEATIRGGRCAPLPPFPSHTSHLHTSHSPPLSLVVRRTDPPHLEALVKLGMSVPMSRARILVSELNEVQGRWSTSGHNGANSSTRRSVIE